MYMKYHPIYKITYIIACVCIEKFSMIKKFLSDGQICDTRDIEGMIALGGKYTQKLYYYLRQSRIAFKKNVNFKIKRKKKKCR